MTVVIATPIKLSAVIKAKEPRLQNEIERASDRDAIADAMPTKEVKIADIAIPTMINVKEESDPLIDANLKVSAVVNKAPTVPLAIAPKDPTCTTPELIASTAPKDAPAAVPKMAGSATALLQAPCANKPATPSAAPTKAERIEYAQYVPEKNAHIWAAATMELGALICTAKNPVCGRCPVAEKCQWRSLDYPASERVKRTQTWHGTDRQCRGTIVQALRENSTLNKKQIHLLWDVPSQVEKALLTLLDDGLIEERRKNTYSLPR